MNEPQTGWHLSKTINIGHLISTVIIGVSVFTWAKSVDLRIEKNTQSIVYVMDRQHERQQQINNVRTELRADLKVINAKLDRLVEQRHN